MFIHLKGTHVYIGIVKRRENDKEYVQHVNSIKGRLPVDAIP